MTVPQHQTSQQRRLLQTPLAFAISCALLPLVASPAWADDTANDTATIASLRAEIQRLQSELAQRKTAPTTPQTTAAQAPAPTSTASDDDDDDDTTATDSSQPQRIEVKAKKKKKQQLVLEKLKKTTQSVSIVSGDVLQQQQSTSITDVLRRVSNVNFNYGNSRTGSLTLRGITTSSTDTIDPSVGVVIDGVPIAYTPLANGATYVDVDTLAVQRGPQGIDGGKNYSVGAIVVNNKLPTFKPEAEASLTYGSWNTVNATAVLGGPVIDDLLAWRGSFTRQQSDGYAKNAYPDLQGRSGYGNTDVTYGRVQFLLTPTDRLSARLSLEDQPNGSSWINGYTVKDSQPLVFSDGQPIGTTTINAAPQNILNRGWFTSSPTTFSAAQYLNTPIDLDNNGAIITNTRGITGQIDYDGDHYHLTSITGYRSNWFSAANDEGTPFDVTKDGGYITTYHQLSQELRLKTGIDNVVDLTTGLYFLYTKNDSLSRTRYGSDAGAWYATGNGSVGNLQYGILANNANATLNASGDQLLTNSLNNLYKGTETFAKNISDAWYGTADWHLTPTTTFTTGLRLSEEKRDTSQSNLILDNGNGAALNPVAVNNAQLGGFASDANGNLLANSASQTTLANQLAQQYFGVGTYSGLSAAQKLQVANAKAVRAGQITGLYQLSTAQPFDNTINSWHLALSQKISDELTGYVAFTHGEKAGISQINGSTASGGTSALVAPESSNVYELGIRSNWLDQTLVVNADIFQDNIKNFQQTVSYLDPVLTALNGAPTYSSGPGNVGGVRVRGIELDAIYTGIKNLTLRAASSYNDAVYTHFPNSGLASELDPALYPTKFYDLSGSVLPNAPKLTATLGADYTQPLPDIGKVLHAGLNYRYTSRYNIDSALSTWGWVGGYGLLDANIGLGRPDGKFDISLTAKNLTDKYYHNVGWTSYTPSAPRWFGVTISGKY